ncbi:uncharacterized protein NPIL_583101, partial [Nephila pilipes]
RYINSVPFDSVNKLANGTYEVSFNRKFVIQDYLNHTDISFRCFMMFLGTPWRSGIVHKMFGASGCKDPPIKIKHGFYNMTEDRSCWNYPTEGSRLQYHCDEGYQFVGSTFYSCTEGYWTPEDGVIFDGDYVDPICQSLTPETDKGPSCFNPNLMLILFLIAWTLYH